MALEDAPIRDDVTDTSGKASRAYTAWFQKVQAAIAAAGGMVYPGAGIALSTGAAWGTSIPNNSTAWNSTTSTVTANSAAWNHAAQAVYNVLDYGVVASPYNSTYCNNAGNYAAMAAVAASNATALSTLVSTILATTDKTGTIYFPFDATHGSGNYLYTGSLDLVSGGGYINVIGTGPQTTFLVQYDATDNAAVPAILFTPGGSPMLAGLSIERLVPGSYHVFPTGHTSGNYGVSIPAGCAEPQIANVFIRYFRDSGFYLYGPTGPIQLVNMDVESCAGYGVVVTGTAGNISQDLNMLGGGIHTCYGGIRDDGSVSTGWYGLDIELNLVAQYPAINLTGAAQSCLGNTYTDITCSTRAAVSALVNVTGTGHVFTGGEYTGNATNTPMVAIASGSHHTFIGGYWVGGSGASAYFMTIGGGVTDTVVINPRLYLFDSGKDVIVDGASNTTTSLNGPTTAGTSLSANVVTAPGGFVGPYVGSSSLVTVGDLASGRVVSGFGSIANYPNASTTGQFYSRVTGSPSYIGRFESDNDTPYAVQVQNRTVATDWSKAWSLYQNNSGEVIITNNGVVSLKIGADGKLYTVGGVVYTL